jgi:hypothetical protein
MNMLSASLLALLDEIAATLAAGANADKLLAELENRWRSERPDDLLNLEALLADLRAQLDEEELEELERQARFEARSKGALFKFEWVDTPGVPSLNGAMRDHAASSLKAGLILV